MKRGMKGQKGQMTLEMVLLLTILVSCAIFAFNEIKSRKLLAAFISGPWQPLKNMIENGEWSADAKEKHPNLMNRHGSYSGDIAP